MSTQTSNSLREDFPMLSQKKEPYVYLDNAATTLKPKPVIEALMAYYQEETATVHRGIYSLSEKATQKQHRVRELIRDFIHAQSEKEIIFTSGTTASINLVAQSFGEAFINEGDEILISQIEHHSNLVPWQMLAQRAKAHLKVIPVSDEAELDLEALKVLLNAKTKLVSLPHVSNAFGVENPIREIIQMVRDNSEAKILIDAAQSIAHQPLDVQSLDIDFLAFSAHKMYGPTGIGVLYGKQELLESMPPLFGGGDMIDRVTLQEASYNELPYKFEAGTPHIAGIMGFGAAIEYLNKVGTQAFLIERDLTQYAFDQLKKIERVSLLSNPQKCSSLVSFTVADAHPLDLATLLNLKGIALRSGHLCAQPGLQRFNLSSVLRISFAFYNTREEVDYFIESLQSSISMI